VRKINPTSVRDDFRSQLTDLTTFHNTCLVAFTNGTDKSTLTERTLLAAAVAWEGFVSDMFIAYINTDATRFKQHLEDSFDTHLKGSSTPQKVFEKYGSITFPKHLSKADVLELADSLGNNITFSKFALLEKKAGTWLIATHADKFKTLNGRQKAVVNSIIALRNHIAHRSDRSLTAMNALLNENALTPTGIKRGNKNFHNVGAWLKAVPVGRQQTRFAIIMQILDGIAATF
jgi:hypothetical protein